MKPFTFSVACFLLLFTGCVVATSSRIHSDTWTTNKAGEVTHEIRDMRTPGILAWGDAKAFIEKLRMSNGKTQSIGLSGFDTETTTTNLPAVMKAGGELIGAAAAEFMKKSLSGGVAP